MGKRPPSNPAIRVRFPVLLSRRVTRIFMRDLDSSDKKRNTPSIGEERSSTLSLYEGERSPENWPYDGVVLWSMTSYTLLRNSSNLLQYQFTYLIYDGVRTLIGNRPRLDRRFLSCQYDEARLEGNRKEDNRTEKKIKKNKRDHRNVIQH